MLIRLAWRWLERWQEPLLVGTAVTLIGLSSLLPAAGDASAPQRLPDQGSQQVLATAAQRSTLLLPTDAQFYRDQWEREAKQFYSLHPPRPSGDRQMAAQVAPVAAAAFTAGRPEPAPLGPAYTAEAPPGAAAVPAGPAPPPTLGHEMRAAGEGKLAAAAERLRRWRVAGCLAAGVCASLIFAVLWPSAVDERHRAKSAVADLTAAARAELAPRATDLSTAETIAIHLPAAWVRVRPTMGQTVRRGVLVASYLLAGLGGWSLLG